MSLNKRSPLSRCKFVWYIGEEGRLLLICNVVYVAMASKLRLECRDMSFACVVGYLGFCGTVNEILLL